jgi:DNA-binding LytR/AlgR family response regulator
MEKFNCIIVEDEPLAAEVLQDYVSQVPFLNCKAVCRDALFAMQALQKEPIDVLFLDLHLPKIKGFDFLKTLKRPPQVIVTTAYREYALEGYDLSVVDYLVKPIHFSRFLSAVNKLQKQPNVNTAVAVEPFTRQTLIINVNKKKAMVNLDEIIYIESQKEYVNIVTATQSYITKLPLSEVEQQLGTEAFTRVHRSYIIRRDKVRGFSSTDVEVGDIKIPIGRSYKDFVVKLLSGG